MIQYFLGPGQDLDPMYHTIPPCNDFSYFSNFTLYTLDAFRDGQLLNNYWFILKPDIKMYVSNAYRLFASPSNRQIVFVSFCETPCTTSFSEYQYCYFQYYLNLLFPNEHLSWYTNIHTIDNDFFFITGYIVVFGSLWIYTRFIWGRVHKRRVTTKSYDSCTVVCLSFEQVQLGQVYFFMSVVELYCSTSVVVIDG